MLSLSQVFLVAERISQLNGINYRTITGQLASEFKREGG